MQAQLRAHHDDRAARVVDALAQQVLAEAALLALEHVGQRLERALAATADRLAAAPVVEQGVHRLLQHPLLVAQDDLGRPHLHQLLQPVVAVDHAPVEIVEVRGGEAAAVERHEGPQVRRQHGNHVEDHPVGPVAAIGDRVAVAEGVHHLEPLQVLLLAMLAGLGRHLTAQLLGQVVDIDLLQERANRFGPDLGLELRVVLFLRLGLELEVLLLLEQLLDLDLLAARLGDHVVRVVDHLLQVAQRHPQQVAHLRGQRLEEPDVRHRHGQLDVPHPLAPHLRQRDLHAALVADVAAVADPLELAAVALPVLDRAEDALAEQAVALRLEGPVIDRLRLGHFAVAERTDLLGRSDLQLDVVELGRPTFAVPWEVDHIGIILATCPVLACLFLNFP